MVNNVIPEWRLVPVNNGAYRVEKREQRDWKWMGEAKDEAEGRKIISNLRREIIYVD